MLRGDRVTLHSPIYRYFPPCPLLSGMPLQCAEWATTNPSWAQQFPVWVVAHASPSTGRGAEAPGIWTLAGAGEPVRTAFCSSLCSVDPVPRLLVNAARGLVYAACCWCNKQAVCFESKWRPWSSVFFRTCEESNFFLNTLIKHHCFPTRLSDLGILFLLYNSFELA